MPAQDMQYISCLGSTQRRTEVVKLFLMQELAVEARYAGKNLQQVTIEGTCTVLLYSDPCILAQIWFKNWGTVVLNLMMEEHLYVYIENAYMGGVTNENVHDYK